MTGRYNPYGSERDGRTSSREDGSRRTGSSRRPAPGVTRLVCVACALLVAVSLVFDIATCTARIQPTQAVLPATEGEPAASSGAGEPAIADEPADDASAAVSVASQAVVGFGSGIVPQTDEAVALTSAVAAALPVVDVSLDPDAAYVTADGQTISTAITDAVTVANAAQYLDGVEDPWVSTGRFTTGDAELDQLVKAYCDAHSTDERDATDNAYYTYLSVAWAEYLERDNDQDPWSWGDVWPIVYSKQLLATESGNCYEFAALSAYCLRYFGYSDAAAEPCLVLLQSGNYGDHGLVLVTNWTGVSSIIDPALGADGWMLPETSYTYKLKHEA